ncbi:MAG TPA: hypothetical protein VJ461_05090 [Candidatus Nanoarchaeia archaeon]|nr:hypothetical protein [Candidatus Nanoarchaeia archaeon]
MARDETSKQKLAVPEKQSFSEKKDDRKNSGALFIPAGIFIGMGWGFLVENIPGGLFLGLGFGFVAFAITTILMNTCCKK